MENTTKRIAKNTLMLYFRQILVMLVSLYTVRVVLNTLGAADYGIYNVVAGVVTMFSFLGNAMATASQRYFSFDLGKKDEEHLKITFSITFQIYILLALFVVILAETIGVWFVNHRLVIPEERLVAANWIFQAAVISFLLTLVTTPYMAAIIAHENMNVYAYVSIAEVGLNLGIVFILRLVQYDKLIVYGILLAVVSLIKTSLYRFYCHSQFSECRFKIIWNKNLFIEIIGYSGWNLFGSISTVVRNQGITILLNLFFGPVVNAARAVSSQVSGAVMSFAQNFSNALRPHIIKLYAAEKKDETLRMLIYSTKIVFFLMLIICVPLYFESPYLIQLWLKNVPDHTVLFVKLITIHALIDSISYPLMSVVQATGKIKLYQVVVGGSRILNLPVSYIFLKMGFAAQTVFIVEIIISIVSLFLRIIIVQKIINVNLFKIFSKLLLLFVVLVGTGSSLPIFIINYFTNNFLLFTLFVIITTILNCIFIFFIGLDSDEKKKIIQKCHGVLYD